MTFCCINYSQHLISFCDRIGSYKSHQVTKESNNDKALVCFYALWTWLDQLPGTLNLSHRYMIVQPFFIEGAVVIVTMRLFITYCKKRNIMCSIAIVDIVSPHMYQSFIPTFWIPSSWATFSCHFESSWIFGKDNDCPMK